jgi:transglutaminase-like putative cysteine protease
MYIKIVSFLSVFVFSLFLFPKIILASDFETDTKVSYTINEEGLTTVEYTIIIENMTEKSLQKGYDLILSHITPTNIIIKEDGVQISPELKGSGTETHIITHFEKPLNGIGKKKTVTIHFTTDSIVKESGDIKEIAIPKLLRSENFRNYNVTLLVPNSFGEEAYISPKSQTMIFGDTQKIYTFKKEDLLDGGVQATFGKFQVYDLNLTYHLKNDSWEFVDSEIALPPDTSLQKIYIDELIPQPNAIHADEDGNWIAHFNLYPKEKKDITFKGKSLLFANPRRLLAPPIRSLLKNTQPSHYWQTDDQNIHELAQKLKTPEEIYRYVVATLSYNYNRATPNAQRLGAAAVLAHPDDAICTEFTDLFIALTRSAGIPAREIEGFAQSENPKVQPLALSSDVLHSWPEYWDSKLETWISVDPTWEKTTGGQDYFSKFDMKHVAFAIHGENDSYPAPAGTYKEGKSTDKDIYVSLSTLDESKDPKLHLSFENKTMIPFGKNKWIATIKNESKVALYNQRIELVTDQVPQQLLQIDTLLPYETSQIAFQTPVGFLGKDIPKTQVIQSGSSAFILPQNKLIVVIIQFGIFLFTLIFAIWVGIWFFRKK